MGKSALVFFHEEQAFRQWHARLVLAMPPAALIFVTVRQLVWHHAWGTSLVSSGGLLFLTALLVLVYVRLITVRLVTDLGPTEIAVGLRGQAYIACGSGGVRDGRRVLIGSQDPARLAKQIGACRLGPSL